MHTADARSPEADSPSDNDSMLSADFRSRFADQFEAASRRAGQEKAFEFSVGEAARVFRVDAVHILQRVDRICHLA